MWTAADISGAGCQGMFSLEQLTIAEYDIVGPHTIAEYDIVGPHYVFWIFPDSLENSHLGGHI